VRVLWVRIGTTRWFGKDEHRGEWSRGLLVASSVVIRCDDHQVQDLASQP